jgi:hypothetical protein
VRVVLFSERWSRSMAQSRAVRSADPGGDGNVVEAGQLYWWVKDGRNGGRVRAADAMDQDC